MNRKYRWKETDNVGSIGKNEYGKNGKERLEAKRGQKRNVNKGKGKENGNE